MPLTRIRELYVVELSTLCESEKEILHQLPLMSASARNPLLRDLFDAHYRRTHLQAERLATIFDLLDERRRPAAATGIRGLVEEARLRQSWLDSGDLLDLALIDTGRRISHYEIAAYSAALTYARRVGDSAGAALLLETLDEERQMEGHLEPLTLPPVPRVAAAITAA
jgi:Mn-containing catalase